VILITAGVAALTFALVKGSDWGWGSAGILGALLGGVVLIALFVLHCLRSRTPLIQPSLFRSRSFTGASLVAIAFSASFGAMLLSIVLWEQGAWGWSALQSGLSIAPGPLMVPLFSFLVAGRLIARWGPAMVIGLGSIAFSVGVGWWAVAVTAEPNYVSGVLGGMILTGIGVGLTLPTMMATASTSLPPQSFATGSAVINMVRQIGIALGVALLVAVLGTSAGRVPPLTAFQHAWWLIAALAFTGIVPALGLLRRPASATVSA
jgi:MFS family permease